MSDLDQRMHDWAIKQLASWGIEPTVENVDRLLNTFLAARQRLYFAVWDLEDRIRLSLFRTRRRLERAVVRRRRLTPPVTGEGADPEVKPR